ncbi:MAG TPA: PepSY domain-containing protein [Phycisphaerae bacterium]|nr:PepSY domain-containing protein [Phycisphaerae bacterium]
MKSGRVWGVIIGLAAMKITVIQAIDAAQKEVAGGKATEAALETEKESIFFAVNILLGDAVKEVKVDAVSGKVLGVKDEAPEEAEPEEAGELKQAHSMAKITFAQAIEAAEKEIKDGKVFKIELELKGKEARYKAVLIAADTLWVAAVDAAGGKVLFSRKVGEKREEQADDSQWRKDFKVDKANWVDQGRNPYFILEPGHRCQYKHGAELLTITVLDETKVVDGVTTRVVEEREEKNGKPTEISRNYFAIDKSTNDIYYFGEDVDIYKGGKVVGHEGAWMSGVNGAQFGLMMPAQPKVGDKFYQEIAPKVAMDRAEIVSLDEKLDMPAGRFEKCLHVKETTPLESGVSHKWYVAGVGLVKDDEFVLVKPEAPAPKNETEPPGKGARKGEKDR